LSVNRGTLPTVAAAICQAERHLVNSSHP
jgi:hypothetical protein